MKDLPQQVDFYRRLGENIRRRRIDQNLSQEVLAKLVGLTRTSLTNIESGRQHPPLFTLCEIAEQLKVQSEDLLPVRKTSDVAIDLQKVAGQQVRGKDELAFIASAIGLKETTSHADTEKKNPNSGRITTRGK